MGSQTRRPIPGALADTDAEIAVARNSGGRSSHRDVDLKPHTKKPGRSRDPASQAVLRVVDQNFMLAWM